MTKHLQLTTSVILAFIVGVLFAGISTSIRYPCPPLPDDPRARCASYQKALLHLNDLASNTQDSLTRLLINFLVGF
jgi:hypothetical protein